jgi:hypothetical protein
MKPDFSKSPHVRRTPAPCAPVSSPQQRGKVEHPSIVQPTPTATGFPAFDQLSRLTGAARVTYFREHQKELQLERMRQEDIDGGFHHRLSAGGFIIRESKFNRRAFLAQRDK